MEHKLTSRQEKIKNELDFYVQQIAETDAEVNMEKEMASYVKEAILLLLDTEEEYDWNEDITDVDIKQLTQEYLRTANVSVIFLNKVVR